MLQSNSIERRTNGRIFSELNEHREILQTIRAKKHETSMKRDWINVVARK